MMTVRSPTATRRSGIGSAFATRAAGPSSSRRSRSTSRPGPWSSRGATPATTRPTPASRPTSPPASTAARPSAPRPTPTRTIPRPTRSRARPTSWARRPITSRAAIPSATPRFGYGNQMGLAVFDGQVYPGLGGQLQPELLDTATARSPPIPLNIWYRPMVIAAGPRIINSTMGPIPLAEAASRTVSISVTFDRPVDPATCRARRCPGLLPRHHQRRCLRPALGDGRHPGRAGNGPAHAYPVHGHLQPDASRREPGDVQLHRDLQLPDRSGQRQRHGHQLADLVVRQRRRSARRPDGPERRRHARPERGDDAVQGTDARRRLRGPHAPADRPAVTVPRRHEHPQPSVQPEHPAADRPRPAGSQHLGAGRRRATAT